MKVGDAVWVGLPLCASGYEPRGCAQGGTVIAIGDRGEVVLKTESGIHTYGGPFSDSRVFVSESEAWAHCAEVLRKRAGEILVAVEKCEEACSATLA